MLKRISLESGQELSPTLWDKADGFRGGFGDQGRRKGHQNFLTLEETQRVGNISDSQTETVEHLKELYLTSVKKLRNGEARKV